MLQNSPPGGGYVLQKGPLGGGYVLQELLGFTPSRQILHFLWTFSSFNFHSISHGVGESIHNHPMSSPTLQTKGAGLCQYYVEWS